MIKTHEANSFIFSPMSKSFGRCIFFTVAPIRVVFASVCSLRDVDSFYKLFILILCLVYYSNLDLLFASCMIAWMFVWCFMIMSSW